jgi:hypothetical protein
MADSLTSSITIAKAPAGTEAFKPGGQSFAITLEALPSDQQADQDYSSGAKSGDAYYYPPGATEDQKVLIRAGYFDTKPAETQKLQNQPYASKVKPELTGNEKVICWDLETTGIDVFNSRIILGSFWDLSRPKTEMVTFYDEDEETMVAEMLDWINTEMPDIMTGYNTPFDLKFLTSRAILYQLPAKGIFNAKHHEEMEFWGKGVEQSGLTYTNPGTLEDVALFLFHELKPYAIEACFDAYADGDIMPMFIRNRWDVATEGDAYRLVNYVKAISQVDENQKSISDIPDQPREYAGFVDIQCPRCLQAQVYDYSLSEQHCYICDLPLPKPTKEMIVNNDRIINLEAYEEQHAQYVTKEGSLEQAQKAYASEEAMFEEYRQTATGETTAKKKAATTKATTTKAKTTTTKTA